MHFGVRYIISLSREDIFEAKREIHLNNNRTVKLQWYNAFTLWHFLFPFNILV
jgi:hypothetical protein